MKRHDSAEWSSTGRLTTVALAAGVLVGTSILGIPVLAADSGRDANGSTAKHSNGPCQDVAQDAMRSCQGQAKAAYWLALARCDNETQSGDKTSAAAGAKRSSCDKAASGDLKDQRQQCSAQLVSRSQICEELGGGVYDPEIDPTSFTTNIDNPYSPMVPGTTFVYEGDTANGHERDEVKVTNGTRTIDGVTCLAVRDTSTLDTVLSEDTTDWFAQDAAGNVWYFGEEAKQLADGALVGIEGSWMAGVNDAKPGIVMEAHPKVDDIYRQEFAIGVAEDMGRVAALSQPVTVPFGSFANALETMEFSGLEPDSTEHKFYVASLGFVLSVDDQTGERLELVSISH